MDSPNRKFRSMDECEYRFVIDVFKPDTIPMARLAEYMSDLARLLGFTEHVHFKGVEEGSLELVQQIEPGFYPLVRGRLQSIPLGTDVDGLLAAYDALNAKLQRDKAKASLINRSGETIDFPGRDLPEPMTFGPFSEEGTLQGELVRIGGKDETKHLTLQDGRVSYSNIDTTEEIARDLAHHLFNHVRVNGMGRWLRQEDGAWKLVNFNVKSFEVLSDEALINVVARLRSVTGNQWSEDPEAFQKLLSLRDDDGQVH